ncbi:MAG TPA: glutamate-1-semialdehyde 2,1-aminomutase [Burkholderiales bacterium]|nr:glutamate-1-semialdehyde 2,1-aminomutase [Burkholderiales bacterium]
MASRNQELFEQSQKLIPGGVNSPVRAFKSVGGTPPFITRGQGATVWDADGKAYTDYVGSWGPLILGHAHPDIVAAVQRAAADGLSFGAPTAGELELAQLLCRLLPSLQQVRLVSSGTEATMSAIRLARGFTGRKRILKFAGCYHGHADSLLVKAGSGALTLGQPDSAGVPAETAALTLVLEFNDSGSLHRIFKEIGNEIAAVIVEPVAGNMSLVKPKTGFLQLLRDLCTTHGAVLIFDEVMTGFRVALHGAQGLYGISPDLTTLGKVIGGGMPLAAFGGRHDIMQRVAPCGPVYQAGTLSGNPLAVAVGLATLRLVQVPGFYEKLSRATQKLCDGLNIAAQKHRVAFCSQAVGGMFGIYFRQTPPQNYAEVTQCNALLFNGFFHEMLQKGVYLAPSPFEAGFVSAAHGDEEIAATVSAAEQVFSDL